MNTNIKISLTDNERELFNKYLGLKGLTTRKQLTEFVEATITATLRNAAAALDIRDGAPLSSQDAMTRLRQTYNDPALENKSESYIIGYNKVKFRNENR